MGGVRLGVREALPADERAGPVPAAGLAGTDELAVLHRGDPAGAVGAAVVGDPAVGRHPGAREHERARVRAEQRGERGGIRHTGDSRTGEPVAAPPCDARLATVEHGPDAVARDSPVPPRARTGRVVVTFLTQVEPDGSAGQEPRGRATPAPAVSSGPQRRGTGRSTTVHRLIRGAVAGAAALCLASIGTLDHRRLRPRPPVTPVTPTITVDINDSEAGGTYEQTFAAGLRRHHRGRHARLHLRPRGRARTGWRASTASTRPSTRPPVTTSRRAPTTRPTTTSSPRRRSTTSATSWPTTSSRRDEDALRRHRPGRPGRPETATRSSCSSTTCRTSRTTTARSPRTPPATSPPSTSTRRG